MYRELCDKKHPWDTEISQILKKKKKKKWVNDITSISIQISTIMEIILWDFLMFYQIFLSPQVKRSAIISNKQGIYELPQENQENLQTC